MTPEKKGKNWQYIGVAGGRGGTGKSLSNHGTGGSAKEVRASGKGRGKRGTRLGTPGEIAANPAAGHRRMRGRAQHRSRVTTLLVWLAAFVVVASLSFLLAKQSLVVAALGMLLFLVFAWWGVRKS